MHIVQETSRCISICIFILWRMLLLIYFSLYAIKHDGRRWNLFRIYWNYLLIYFVQQNIPKNFYHRRERDEERDRERERESENKMKIYFVVHFIQRGAEHLHFYGKIWWRKIKEMDSLSLFLSLALLLSCSAHICKWIYKSTHIQVHWAMNWHQFLRRERKKRKKKTKIISYAAAHVKLLQGLCVTGRNHSNPSRHKFMRRNKFYFVFKIKKNVREKHRMHIFDFLLWRI